jgi:hypothetical protein
VRRQLEENRRYENGAALLIAMMATLLMAVLGGAMLLSTSAETIIASNFRASAVEAYAADAALERMLDGLPAVPDWSLVPSGLTPSPFVDGPPNGQRVLPDGTTVDLGQVVNAANCQKTTTCTASDMDAVTLDRPWGSGNPRWTLYGYGPLSAVLPPGRVSSPCYVVVLAATAPGSGEPFVLALRAEAYGVLGAHTVVEATVARADFGVRLRSWRTIR